MLDSEGIKADTQGWSSVICTAPGRAEGQVTEGQQLLDIPEGLPDNQLPFHIRYEIHSKTLPNPVPPARPPSCGRSNFAKNSQTWGQRLRL